MRDKLKGRNVPNSGLSPNLRFPDFTEAWEETSFSEIGTFFKGKGISKEQLSEEGTPCILYGELYTRYKNEVIDEVYSRTSINIKGLVTSNSNDVIIPSSGESAIDIATACCVILDDILLGGDLNIIRPHKDNGSFISYQLNGKRKNDIAKIAQGSSVIHLYNDGLKQLKVFLPKEQIEQDKVANFLSSINKRISVQSQIIKELETLIKGLRDKLFSQKLRFKDDDGNDFAEWEMNSLGEVLKIPEKIKPIRIEKSKLLTVRLHLKGVFKNESTDGLSIGSTNYYLRKKGQFVYGKQNLFNGAFGIVPDEFDGFLSSGDIPSLDIDNNKINNIFLFNFFARETFYKKLEDIASGSGSKRIHEETLFKVEIQLPCLKEQNKLASFLSVLNKKVKNEKAILILHENQKKYLSQNLFT